MPDQGQIERIREEEGRFEADVEYEVWRSGGNPDMVDRDRVQDWSPDVEGAAKSELKRQRKRREEHEALHETAE